MDFIISRGHSDLCGCIPEKKRAAGRGHERE